MDLGNLPVPGRPTIWIIVEQGPIALAVGAGGGCLDIFILLYLFSPLSLSFWEMTRYRLKYCLKGLLNPKQQSNPPFFKTQYSVQLLGISCSSLRHFPEVPLVIIDISCFSGQIPH